MSGRERAVPWWTAPGARYEQAVQSHRLERWGIDKTEKRDGWWYAFDTNMGIVGVWRDGLFEPADNYAVNKDDSYR